MSLDSTTGPELSGTYQTRTFYWHYAWVIVSIIAVMQMVGASVRMAFGVFIDPLTATYGWGQGTVTFAYALASIVTALVSPLAGSFGDRVGARRAMMAGSVLFVIGMALTGTITEPWQLYLYFGVLLGVAQAIFLVPLIPAAMIWYRRHLGLGMGVLMAAWGVGPALAAPILGLLIEQTGWKSTFWITGAASGVIMAILIAFFRDQPSDKGLVPYGAQPGDAIPTQRDVDKTRIKLFARYIRETKAYWNLSSIHFLGCVGHAIIIVYIIPIAVFAGISLVAAASLLTVMSAVSVSTRLIVPILSERAGTKTTMTITYILQGVTVLPLYWAHDLWQFYVFAVIFGIGYGGESGAFPILNRKYFGHAPVGIAHGFQMLGAGLGMALGGWIGGVIFDTMNSYDLVIAISIVASLVGAVSVVFLEPTHVMLIPDWEAATDADAEQQPSAAPRAAPSSETAD
jgi:MFS family permease